MLKKDNTYPWEFYSIGGVTRVAIRNGQDIAHLPELDQKLWTVLSCPTGGFEFDETTLGLMDTNQDGKIHVNEVNAAATWLTTALKNADDLMKGEGSISLDALADNEDGAKIRDAAKAVLAKVGKAFEGKIGLDDVDKALAMLAEESAAELKAEEKVLPYGEDTEAALSAVNTIKAKIDDYFMRCKLAAFNTESTATLDLSAKRIEAISEKNLPECMDEIATYPLFRIDGSAAMPLDGGVNPAWKAAFDSLKSLVFDKDFAGERSVSETDWLAIQAKFDEYVKWKASVEKAAEEFREGQKTEADTFTLVKKFLHLYRDFFKFVNNFVTMTDFYNRDPENLAVFQAGQLYIDQRRLDLCVRVSDMGRQLAQAGKSNMFILYCDCVSKQGGTMQIAAILTDGDISSLHEGQNAIFYDRDGLDWDATVTKIVDNPISIRQAFWLPYRRFAKWCSERFNKKAADKESSSSNLLAEKAEGAKPSGPEAAAGKKQAFDIAKFAGIFAAIGMAVGFILDALVGLLDSILKMPWWGFFVLIAAVVLIISGPAMIIAWSKLRKRSLSPVLNANGWAINSRIRVNMRFGATLTSLAQYPKVVGRDPYSDKAPLWKRIIRWFAAIVVILGIAALILYRHDNLRFLGIENEKAAAEKVEAEAAAEAQAEPAPAAEAAPEAAPQETTD